MSDQPPSWNPGPPEPPSGGHGAPPPGGYGAPPPGGGYQPPSGGYPPPPPPPPGGASPSSFLASLFDFSFRTFITGRLVTVLYALSVAGIGLWSLVWLGSAVASGDGAMMVLAFIGVPLFALFALVYVRVLLEVIVILFRIGEDVRTIAQRAPGAPPR